MDGISSPGMRTHPSRGRWFHKTQSIGGRASGLAVLTLCGAASTTGGKKFRPRFDEVFIYAWFYDSGVGAYLPRSALASRTPVGQ